jgi:hypothetical protein
VLSDLPSYATCNSSEALGDGFCDADLNTEVCGWDGGDCCEDTCVEGSYPCGDNGFDCIDPSAGGTQPITDPDPSVEGEVQVWAKNEVPGGMIGAYVFAMDHATSTFYICQFVESPVERAETCFQETNRGRKAKQTLPLSSTPAGDQAHQQRGSWADE